MEQQISLAPNIISYFYESLAHPFSSLDITDSQKCYDLLKQNYIIIDNKKELPKLLLKELNSIEDEQRRNLLKVSLGKLLEDRMKPVSFQLDNSDFQYFKLCNASEDKIYLDPEIDDEDLNKLKVSLFNNGLSDIEINTLQSFLNPSERSKLNHQSVISFKKEKQYKLDEILKPFVREAHTIKIIDNFIANKKALYHFEKLLRKMNKSARIELVTLSKEDYLNRKEDKVFASKNYDKLLKLVKDFKIDLPPNETSGHLERYIVTDKFEISLPGGFDQFNLDGTPNIKNDSSILKMVITDKFK